MEKEMRGETKRKQIGFGRHCPKCGVIMARFEHPVGWEAKTNYWFRFWDICQKCQHLQHYEEAKVYKQKASITEPLNPFIAYFLQ
jgi:hypothetical protein